MTDVEPTRDFTPDPRTVYYVETVGAIRYHLYRDCHGLKTADAPIQSTTAEIVERNGALEIVKKGRNLCRICAPLPDDNTDG